MKILFITSDYPSKGGNIYTDLAEALTENGHDVKVVVAEEKKKLSTTKLIKERNLDVLRVKTGNIYQVGFIEKTLTFLTISRDLKKEIKKNYNNEKFDLILFHTPPVTIYGVVKWAMKKFKCKSYLMQKDIFPQNGVDIGLYSKKHPAYIYFRMQEKKLYKSSSVIGCMSQGNIDYLIKNNQYLDKNKFELFPNTVKLSDKNKINQNDKDKIRKKYGIDKNDVVAIFGGNFGKPQGLDFMIEVLKYYKNSSKIKFILIGRGTEKEKVFNYIKENNITNVLTFDFIPKDDYELLSGSCDIGLIFLDKRFTIPNFPSKTLSYFECGLPIMAAIDENTDYGKMLDESNSGYWSLSGNIKDYTNKFNKLIDNEKLRTSMGKNGRRYLEKNYTVERSVKILEAQFYNEVKDER